MKEEAFYKTAGKSREYSLFFDLQSLIGRSFFSRKPPNNNGYCNLGCGPRYIDKYVNADFFSYNILRKFLKKKQYNLDWQIDLRYKLNCKNNYFEGILLEHVLEHLNILDGINLIKELYRILKPGGILRISVPSLKIYSNYYLNSVVPSEKFNMWNECRSEAMWNLSFNYGHNCAYDFELLKKVISESSFEKVYESSFNESKNIMLKVDDPGRRWESLYVEAIK